MAVTITDGWLSGSLPDDTGKHWPIVRHEQTPTGLQKILVPNLVLHTTETDSYIPQLKFPSNFQCGDGVIGQHIRLGFSGDAVLVHDNENIGIEMVSRSKLYLWLPAESTLGPTVALVAWLHSAGRIKTGIKRPAKWPDVLDRGPEAVLGYYRRHAGLWPNVPGVYGHVDLPDNQHYDPGSFNYPKFFARVQTVLNGGGEEVAFADYKDGVRDSKAGEVNHKPANADYTFGYNQEERIKHAAGTPTPVPGPPGPKGEPGAAGAVKPHTHTYTGTTNTA